MCQFHIKFFIVRPISAVRPYSETKRFIIYINLAVTEDGLKAKTGQAIKILLCNWYIFYLTSHHNELPLNRIK